MYYGPKYISDRGKEAGKDLAFKEIRYFCNSCGWMAEKNTFMVPQCPKCLSSLWYVYQDEDKQS